VYIGQITKEQVDGRMAPLIRVAGANFKNPVVHRQSLRR
jgi:hypothetical protein